MIFRYLSKQDIIQFLSTDKTNRSAYQLALSPHITVDLADIPKWLFIFNKARYAGLTPILKIPLLLSETNTHNSFN
jgi:hypothetical protein